VGLWRSGFEGMSLDVFVQIFRCKGLEVVPVSLESIRSFKINESAEFAAKKMIHRIQEKEDLFNDVKRYISLVSALEKRYLLKPLPCFRKLKPLLLPKLCFPDVSRSRTLTPCAETCVSSRSKDAHPTPWFI